MVGFTLTFLDHIHNGIMFTMGFEANITDWAMYMIYSSWKTSYNTSGKILCLNREIAGL